MHKKKELSPSRRPPPRYQKINGLIVFLEIKIQTECEVVTVQIESELANIIVVALWIPLVVTEETYVGYKTYLVRKSYCQTCALIAVATKAAASVITIFFILFLISYF